MVLATTSCIGNYVQRHACNLAMLQTCYLLQKLPNGCDLRLQIVLCATWELSNIRSAYYMLKFCQHIFVFNIIVSQTFRMKTYDFRFLNIVSR
jgi:hypothetical protein